MRSACEEMDPKAWKKLESKLSRRLQNPEGNGAIKPTPDLQK